MDKFINKDGKVVLTIDDDGKETLDPSHFFKDGTLVITRTSDEEGHYHEFDPTDLSKGTETANDHKHDIKERLILPAGDNGHTHALPMGV